MSKSTTKPIRSVDDFPPERLSELIEQLLNSSLAVGSPAWQAYHASNRVTTQKIEAGESLCHPQVLESTQPSGIAPENLQAELPC